MWLAGCVRAWSSHFHSKNIASILPLRVSPSSANPSHKPSFARTEECTTGIGLLRPCMQDPQPSWALWDAAHDNILPFMGAASLVSLSIEVWQLSPCLSHMSIVHTWYSTSIILFCCEHQVFTPFMVIASTMEVDYSYIPVCGKISTLAAVETNGVRTKLL